MGTTESPGDNSYTPVSRSRIRVDRFICALGPASAFGSSAATAASSDPRIDEIDVLAAKHS